MLTLEKIRNKAVEVSHAAREFLRPHRMCLGAKFGTLPERGEMIFNPKTNKFNIQKFSVERSSSPHIPSGEPWYGPRLLAVSIGIGGVNYVVPTFSWSHWGYIKFSCRDISDDSRHGETVWSGFGKSGTSLTGTGLTLGQFYTLDYKINCEPDIEGHDEDEWLTTTLEWEQVAKPPIGYVEYEWEFTS
jgi:hypothetical protein